MRRVASRSPRGPRVARGLCLASASAALAIMAHGSAGGGFPDTGLTLLLTALIGWVATATPGRGPIATMGLLAVGQLAMHIVLTVPPVLDHHPGATAEADPVAMLGLHGLAVLLTGVLLTSADTAVEVVLRRVSPIVVAPVCLPAPRPLSWVPVAPAVVPGHGLRILLTRSLARRGPPADS